jgi:hypothetical protein
MLLTASSLVLTFALTSGATEPAATRVSVPFAEAVATVALNDATPTTAPDGPLGLASNRPAWMTEVATTRRPGALPAMYATLGLLQALDVYSTRRALNTGGMELNPVMRGSSKQAGTMLAVKALATAGSIFFTERAWKKNRKGAVVLMAVMNGVTAAVVANNMKNTR